MIDNNKKRDTFVSKWGFILACIGSAVGMGNIWLFPSRVSAFGGGSFLIPYFIFIVIIGFSGVIGEMSFGRATKSGPMGAFKAAVESRKKNGAIGSVLGAIPTLGSLALAIGYSVVVGWILKYTFGTFTGATLEPNSVDAFGAKFGAMASHLGNTSWQLIGLLLVFGIMIAGVANGIEKANKIMMPLFFVLFIALAIYVLFQPGALNGYKYIFSIDTDKLFSLKTWIFALGQAFFSLSLAGNGTLIYGSYLKDKEDIVDSAKKVTLFDTIAAMLAALVIIPAVATTGSQLSSGGPGLMFVHLPNLFKNMPMGNLIVIVFFIAVTFAGVSSLINLFEAPVATLEEKLNLSRWQAVAVIAAISSIVSILIQGIISGWMDFISIYILPLGAILAGIMFFWVFGSKFARDEIQKGRKKKIGKWLTPMTKYVFCGITILVFILGIVYKGIG